MTNASEVHRLTTHPAKRLTILLGARDHYHHGSLFVHLMQRARRAKLAGATAFEAYEGYGASRQVHGKHLMTDDSPIGIVIIDGAERIEAFLLDASDLLQNIVTLVADIEIVEP